MKLVVFKTEYGYYDVSILFMKYYSSSLVFKIGCRTTGKNPDWVESLTPYVMYGKYKPIFNFGDEE